ncbi:hypothetical protein [Ligilactobacillus agilis]|uniref:hypothetical protein n=1 Tax=Ligilactobacillus agilis TaxID=1601 RepID=UPI00242D5BE3|nr:hypothetical protein [Ligilactobacillus agilis]
MTKNDFKVNSKVSWLLGLSGGILADGLLRILTGEEGNLLVHTMVFGFFAGLVYLGSRLVLRLLTH